MDRACWRRSEIDHPAGLKLTHPELSRGGYRFLAVRREDAAAVSLHFMHYNFGRIHKTLRVTPAMEAGVADHVWSLEEIVALMDRESGAEAA